MKKLMYYIRIALIKTILMLSVTVLICTFILAPTQNSFAETKPAIWKVLLAEAASEGYDGMYAVAYIIRNRGGSLRGFYGAKRKDLDEFCDRQKRKYRDMAKSIERRVFEEAGHDTTRGATHFENVEAFGKPYWAEDMIVTVKIGRHTFYKEKKQ